MRLKFTKMHGLGNDFIVFDAPRPHEVPTPAQLRRLADRRTGIGFDQALVLSAPRSLPVADAFEAWKDLPNNLVNEAWTRGVIYGEAPEPGASLRRQGA